MNKILNFFWQKTIFNDSYIVGAPMEEKRVERSKFILSIFYFFIFLISFKSLSSYPLLALQWNQILQAQELFLPIWSAQWIAFFDWTTVMYSVWFFFFGVSLAGIFFWQKSRLLRVLIFIGFFFYLSFISSFGKINHSTHLFLIGAFFFIFLPQEKNEPSKNKNYNSSFLMITWGFLLLILLSYSCSGFFKFYGIIDQEVRGLQSALSPNALGQNIAKVSFATNKEYFFGGYVINHPSYFMSFLLIIGYLVELVAAFVAFLPALHRIFGFVLIMLHSIIMITVGPDFFPQVILIGLFLVMSPFDLEEYGIDFWKNKFQNQSDSIPTVAKK